VLGCQERPLQEQAVREQYLEPKERIGQTTVLTVNFSVSISELCSYQLSGSGPRPTRVTRHENNGLKTQTNSPAMLMSIFKGPSPKSRAALSMVLSSARSISRTREAIGSIYENKE